MSLGSVLLWGFLATLVLTGTLAASQELGLSRMSLPFMLGTAITPDRSRAMVGSSTGSSCCSCSCPSSPQKITL